MKIVHLSTYDNFGSGTGAVNVHKSLLEAGIDSLLITLHRTRNDIPCHKEFRRLKIPQKPILFRLVTSIFHAARRFLENVLVRNAWKQLHGRGIFFTGVSSKYDSLAQADEIQSADILVLHWVAEFLDWPTFFKQLPNNLQIVWRLSDCHPFTGGYHFLDETDAFTREELGKSILKTPLSKFSSRLIYKRKVKSLEAIRGRLSIIAPSRWILTQSQKSSVFKEAKHFHIPSCVNFDTFCVLDRSTSRLSCGLKSPSFLFIASYVDEQRKGFALVVEALGLLSPLPIYLATVGIPSKLEVSIPSNVSLVQFGEILAKDSINLILNASDAIVIGSRDDNLPNVFLEALAAGTPTVAVPTGGMGDQTFYWGELAASRSAVALADAARRFLNSPPINRKELRETAKLYFAPNILAKEYIRIFKLIRPELLSNL